jgi:hypothetical protein
MVSLDFESERTLPAETANKIIIADIPVSPALSLNHGSTVTLESGYRRRLLRVTNDSLPAQRRTMVHDIGRPSQRRSFRTLVEFSHNPRESHRAAVSALASLLVVSSRRVFMKQSFMSRAPLFGVPAPSRVYNQSRIGDVMCSGLHDRTVS